jgi:hypothetical protein
MSTILNALKKLEQENKGNALQPTQDFLDHRSLGYESWRDRLSDFKLRWTWVVVAIIGVGIGFFVAGINSTPIQQATVSSSEKAARTERADRPSAAPPKVNTKPAAIPENVSPNPQQAEKSSPFEPHGAAKAGEPKPAEVPPKPGSDIAANNSRKKAPPAIPPKTQPNTKAASRPAPVNKKASDPQVNNRFSQATRLTDGRLEVQAIAWSPVVEDRMAVINNQVIHQGNTIEGFAVVEIGEDKVLVKEGPQFYVVFFGSR